MSARTPSRDVDDALRRAELFSSPGWYRESLPAARTCQALLSGGTILSIHSASSPSDLNVAFAEAFGTRIINNEWVTAPAVTVSLRRLECMGRFSTSNALKLGLGRTTVLQDPSVAESKAGSNLRIFALGAAEQPTIRGVTAVGVAASTVATPTYALSANVVVAADIARELLAVSGLGGDRLAALFPSESSRGRISRETYQRWVSGRNKPGTRNLQRLLALREILRAADDRVQDVQMWLFTPVVGGASLETPYDVLRKGALGTLWKSLGDLASHRLRVPVTASDGSRGVLITSSVRGADSPTSNEDEDDATDWIGD